MKRAMLAAAVVMVACAIVSAQPVPAPAAPVGKGQVILSWDEFVKITGYDPAKKGPQTLSVSWKEVEGLLGVKVEGVAEGTQIDLPWQEFRKLLEWSVTKKGEKPEVPPPADFIIPSSSYSGVLSSDSAQFTLAMTVDVLRKQGWKRIPVLPISVAVTKSTLPEGVFLNTAGAAYELLTEKSGKLDVSLEFTTAVQTSGGISRANFQRLTGGASLLDLKFTEKVDAKVASAQSVVVAGAGSATRPAATQPAGATEIKATLAAGAPVDISWERALPKVAAAPTKLYSETRTLVAVSDNVLLCSQTVNVNVLHTPIRELKLAVPAGVSVLEVTGNNVQDWRASDKGELVVTMRGEVIGAYSLRVAFEQTAKETTAVPILRVAGVEREMGYIGVAALANVEIDAGEVTGATKIDVRQLPADIVAMTGQPILLAFRYTTDKFAIPLAIKKHAEVTGLVTIADSALFTSMQLSDGRRITKLVYGVRNNRNQFLRAKLPGQAEIWSASVSGNAVSPAKDEKDNVLIPLVRSSGARELASFPVELVYVETLPAGAAQPPSGKLRVELPTVDCPVIHVMFNYYLPAEGDYNVSEGLFAGSRPGFSGPLRLVSDFTNMAAGPGAEVVKRDAAKQVEGMQQEVDAKVDAQARAAGAQPIRVQLPVKGKLFKLEKVLALPNDKLWFEVSYKGWKQGS